MRLYNKYILDMATAWAKRSGLRMLDLGGRFYSHPAFESVDLQCADVNCDLNRMWPLGSNSVGVIIANDILEHLADPIHAMSEIHRVLCHGGLLLSSTPSTDGRGAFQDPTHVSFWNTNSFWYYTRREQAKYIDTPVKFQEIQNYTHFPSEWHKENNIPYVVAHLASIKDGPRLPGLITI